MTFTAESGANVNTWVYVMDDKREQSLLGESDAVRLGTVKLDVKGSTKEVMGQVSYSPKPNPPSNELRYYLSGNDRFCKLDITNCYYQFEIEPSARKLYAFHSPWGIYQYSSMVMGTSPASSEIKKHIREAIKDCKNTIHINDDILVYRVGQEHDQYLEAVLCTLQEKGITL